MTVCQLKRHEESFSSYIQFLRHAGASLIGDEKNGEIEVIE